MVFSTPPNPEKVFGAKAGNHMEWLHSQHNIVNKNQVGSVQLCNSCCFSPFDIHNSQDDTRFKIDMQGRSFNLSQMIFRDKHVSQAKLWFRANPIT